MSDDSNCDWCLKCEACADESDRLWAENENLKAEIDRLKVENEQLDKLIMDHVCEGRKR